jgi:hypothetical protein
VDAVLQIAILPGTAMTAQMNGGKGMISENMSSDPSCRNSNSTISFVKMNTSQSFDFAKTVTFDKTSIGSEIPIPLTLQSVAQDVEYLHIIYFKWDRHESVSSNQNVSIDYVTAISEMEKLDWTFTQNHIGFTNKRKWITLQFVKLDTDKWYVEELINSGVTWDGYLWYAETDSKHLYDMLWRFYHEEPFAMAVPGWKTKNVNREKSK